MPSQVLRRQIVARQDSVLEKRVRRVNLGRFLSKQTQRGAQLRGINTLNRSPSSNSPNNSPKNQLIGIIENPFCAEIRH